MHGQKNIKFSHGVFFLMVSWLKFGDCFFPIPYVLQIQPIQLFSSDLLIHTSLKDKLRTFSMHDLLHYTHSNYSLLHLFHSYAIPTERQKCSPQFLLFIPNIVILLLTIRFGALDRQSVILTACMALFVPFRSRIKQCFMLAHVPSVFHPTPQFCFVTLFII